MGVLCAKCHTEEIATPLSTRSPTSNGQRYINASDEPSLTSPRQPSITVTPSPRDSLRIDAYVDRAMMYVMKAAENDDCMAPGQLSTSITGTCKLVAFFHGPEIGLDMAGPLPFIFIFMCYYECFDLFIPAEAHTPENTNSNSNIILEKEVVPWTLTEAQVRKTCHHYSICSKAALHRAITCVTERDLLPIPANANNDTSLAIHRSIYRNDFARLVFLFCRSQMNSRSIPGEDAASFLEVIWAILPGGGKVSADDAPTNVSRITYADWRRLIKYISTQKDITIDSWLQTTNFVMRMENDLATYTYTDFWPVLIDEYVSLVQEEE